MLPVFSRQRELPLYRQTHRDLGLLPEGVRNFLFSVSLVVVHARAPTGMWKALKLGFNN